MKDFIVKNYTEYDISDIGIPKPLYVEELESTLKSFANKETYDKYFDDKLIRSENKADPYAYRAMNSRSARIPGLEQLRTLFPVLKKSFPKLMFRVTGHFIYGPGDGIDEHTNADDPTNTMYITYATGKSKFSYRFSPNDEFIDTYDNINGLTLRTFEITSKPPFIHHKVECESGYRVSIGLRYVKI